MINRRQALLGATTAGIATIIPSFPTSALTKLRANYEREWTYRGAFDDVYFPHEQRSEVAWKIVERLNDMNAFKADKIVEVPNTRLDYNGPPIKYIKTLGHICAREDFACVVCRSFKTRYYLHHMMKENVDELAEATAIALKKEMDDFLIRMQSHVPNIPLEYYHYLPVLLVRCVNPDTFIPQIGFKTRYALSVKGGEIYDESNN